MDLFAVQRHVTEKTTMENIRVEKIKTNGNTTNEPLDKITYQIVPGVTTHSHVTP